MEQHYSGGNMKQHYSGGNMKQHYSGGNMKPHYSGGNMEKQYSEQFFTSFLESLHDACRNYLKYSQFVEVSGYVCVEIDNMKKERYVLSELLQSSGNVVSESYCTKSFNTYSSSASKMREKSSTQFPRSVMNVQRIEDIPRQAITKPNIYATLSERLQQSSEIPQGQISLNRCGNLQSHDPNTKPLISHESGKFQGKTRGTNCNIEHEDPARHSLITVSPPVLTSLEEPPVSSANVQMIDSGRTCNNSLVEPSSVLQIQPTNYQTFISTAHIDLDSQTQQEDSKASLFLPQKVLESETSVTIPESFSTVIEHETLNVKSEPSSASVDDEDDIIDLDMLEDDIEDSQHCASEFDTLSPDKPGTYRQDSLIEVTFSRAQTSSRSANPGSLKVMRSAVKLFRSYHYDHHGRDIDMFSATPEQLDSLLLDFFQGARKQNGSPPTPTYLKTLQLCLDRHLKEGGYPYSINKDFRFKSSRDYVSGKLETSCKNKVVQKPIPVNDDDIEIMFQKNVLGANSPDSLINTMWFLNSKFFGIRGPADHFNLKWGDIVLRRNDLGQEYLDRSFNYNVSLKVIANPDNPARCYVNMYKQYQSRRPKSVMDDLSPFYLKALKGPFNNEPWFVPDTATWSCFVKMWRKMVSAAGLPSKKKII